MDVAAKPFSTYPCSVLFIVTRYSLCTVHSSKRLAQANMFTHYDPEPGHSPVGVKLRWVCFTAGPACAHPPGGAVLLL